VGTGASKAFGFDPPTLVQPASSGYFGEAEELGRLRLSGILRRLILRNTAFAAISSDIHDQWLNLGVPANRMHRIASGVDTERFRPATDRVESPPRVVYTGRLHPQKNLDVLLNAWSYVRQSTDARLRLIGDGIERERLMALARSLGIAESVEFVGPLDDPAEELRAADLFALPSRCEGMSNSLLEAMASGLPALVSDVGGNRDLIREGVNGRLLPVDDAEAWGRAIVDLLADQPTRSGMGAAARAEVQEAYSIERIVDQYVNLYAALIAQAK